MANVSKHPRAESDLIDIWRYIAQDSPVNADRFLDRLDVVFSNLAALPGMGRLRPEFASDLRSFPVGSYLVFYRPTEDGIDIVRVLHRRRDIPRAFLA